MTRFVRTLPSFFGSLILHAVILVVLLLIPVVAPTIVPEMVLESLFLDEVPEEELPREIELQTTPMDSMSTVTGGTLSASPGFSEQPANVAVDVRKAAVMRESDVRPAVSEAALPSDSLLSMELGEGEITGEVGAPVEGYGAAMGVITQEIIRMMRQQKVTLVWLFDESESLKDDRAEIRENYLQVYRELGLAAERDKDLRSGSELLLTVVAGYGSTVHELTPRPTADVEQIQKAIDLIPVDESGQENMCQAIAGVLSKYRLTAIRGKRKLAVIVVTDESGDDGAAVEEAIAAARTARAPVYFLGRESTFGYPYATQRWVHPASGETFWLRIRRGPETEFPECLQWNGLHARWDTQSAGFGPYEQVRIAKETGGIFFVLPGEEETLGGRESGRKRRHDFMSLREYQPLLLSRPEYVRERSASGFRDALWQVIARLNPSENKLLFEWHDPELNIRMEHYPLLPDPFRAEAAAQAVRAARAMSLTEEGIALLERVHSQRDGESSPRWRAAYDLALAQLYVFRLRLYQFLLAMDRHANQMPAPKNARANEWNFQWSGQAIVPDEAQFARLQQAFGLKMNRSEYLAMVAAEEKSAVGRLEAVVRNHPGTPWAIRAEQEIRSGFGFRVTDRLWDPQGVRATIQVPNL